jgi:hypothetical protein
MEVYCEELQELIAAAIEAAVAEALARRDGHGEPCYYCSEPCNDFAGNPGLWSIALCHSDEPGVVKFHHIGCVQRRVHSVAEERARCATKVRIQGQIHAGGGPGAYEMLAQEIERGN